MKRQSSNKRNKHNTKKNLYLNEDKSSDSSNNENNKKQSAKQQKQNVFKGKRSSDEDSSSDTSASDNEQEISKYTNDNTFKRKFDMVDITVENKDQLDTTFEAKLENSKLIQQILLKQKQIFDKLETMTNLQCNNSIHVPKKNITIVKLTSDQKSFISQFMRNKFPKIKFIRDAEWDQLGSQIMNPIFEKLSIHDDEEKVAYSSIIKSYANSCINQKRAEVMRYLKQIAICKLFFILI